MSKYVKVKNRKYLNTHAFPHGINPEMYKYCEKVLKVKENCGTYFFVEGNSWIWDKDMVEIKIDITMENE